MSISPPNLTAELKVLTLYRFKFFSTSRCNYCIVCHNGLNYNFIFFTYASAVWKRKGRAAVAEGTKLPLFRRIFFTGHDGGSNTAKFHCLFINVQRISTRGLKSVHFKKTVAQSSFLSKVLSFLLTMFWFQWKWHFWKKLGLCNCLLKMNGL